jgi:nicotinate-nucleotide adenylyltransferase
MIYIFGGAFDPPHSGHSAIIRAVLHYKNPTKIIIMPSGIRNDKTYSTPEMHRLAMLDIFVGEIHDPRVCIDRHFVDIHTGTMTTQDADVYARGMYGTDIVHIFGTDTIPSMPQWDIDMYAARSIEKLFIPRESI